MEKFFNNFLEFKDQLASWKQKHFRIVFTNGCFDIIHRGHIEYLNKAKSYGDKLVIGLNSDHSVRMLKGPSRPIFSLNDRAYILINLAMVDAVVAFNEETPYVIINNIIPDVLVKGGDYKIEDIVGRNTVEKNGGKVVTIGFIKGFSSSSIIEKIKK